MNAPMNISSRWLVTCATLCLGSLGLSPVRAWAADDRLELKVTPEKSIIEVALKDQKLLTYTYATSQFKPYIKELSDLNGDSFLLDAPADHLHHHGLMYAITVNGANFWAETPDCGIQKPVRLLDHRSGTSPSGNPEASFSQLIHWIAPAHRDLADTASVALLIERRVITVIVDRKEQEVAVRWRSDFELGQGIDKATLTGASYHGLGIRFPRHFDRVAKHQNSENLPYSVEQKGDVTPARWSAIAHAVDGRDLMLAVFSSPVNAGKSSFFTMLDAFAYVSATQNLEKAPIDYKKGEKFSVDHLVTVYPKHQSREYLEKRCLRWTETAPRK